MEFGIKCITQKAVKGQAVLELLANHPALPREKVAETSVLLTSDSTVLLLVFEEVLNHMEVLAWCL